MVLAKGIGGAIGLIRGKCLKHRFDLGKISIVVPLLNRCPFKRASFTARHPTFSIECPLVWHKEKFFNV
jgi:hypothetical protein